MDRIDAMRAFARLVELGSFSAVAADLRIKQSTASKWIVALEEELQVQLIERTTRAQRVTNAGQLFYQRVKEILAAYENAASVLQEQSPEPSGRLRISIPVVFGRLFLMPIVIQFMEKFSRVEIEMLFSDRYTNLVEENIDIAIRVGVLAGSNFRVKRLGETRRHLIASPEYLKKHPKLHTPKDLRDHQCLLHTELRIGDLWSFRRGEKTESVTVSGRFSANNSEAILAMALRGLGVALLASWLLEENLSQGRLVSLLPEYELLPAPIQALLPPTKHVSPLARAFLDFISASLQERFR
jgi:DNA-binding transcriptional LysR family regulator